MPEYIRTVADIPLDAALWVSRDERRACRERRVLMQQARERAKACVSQAEQEAQAVHIHAYKQGYAQGILQVASDLSALLLQAHTISQTLQQQLEQSAREVVGEWLMDEQLLEALMQRWSVRHRHEADAEVRVLLPQRCRAEALPLKKVLIDAGFERVTISFHDQERYVFRHSDRVIELDINASQERLSPRLIAKLEQLPESVLQLEQASVKLFTDWARQLGETGVERDFEEEALPTDEH